MSFEKYNVFYCKICQREVKDVRFLHLLEHITEELWMARMIKRAGLQDEDQAIVVE